MAYGWRGHGGSLMGCRNPPERSTPSTKTAILATCLACGIGGYLLGKRQPKPSLPPSSPLVVPAPQSDHRHPETARATARRLALDGLSPLKYDDLWEALAETDADPSRPGYVELIYSDESRPADAHGGNVGQWNREHLWPRYRGGVTRGAGPGHWTYIWSDRVTCRRIAGGVTSGLTTAASWCPTRRRELTRTVGSHQLRSEGTLLVLWGMGRSRTMRGPIYGWLPASPTTATDGSLGDLDTLRAWHRADPVDDRERARDAAVRAIQGNGNPFVADMTLLDRVWPAP